MFVSLRSPVTSVGREEGREEGRETVISCLPHVPGPGIIHTRTGDRTGNLGICPLQELNLQPFPYGMMLQATQPQWPGLSEWVLKSQRLLRGG